MKTLLNKKLAIGLVTALLCFTSVKAQIPDKLKNLPPFKFRALMFSSLHNPHAPGKLNDMRCSDNAPCLKKQATLGGTGDDFGNEMIPTHDGGFVIIGGTNSGDGDFKVPASNGSDAYIAKYSKHRQLEWTKTVGGSGFDDFNNVAQTSDGGYIAIGQSESTDGDVKGNHGAFDVLLVKFSVSGNVEWQKSFGGSGDEFGTGVIQTLYGGYAITALSSSNDGNVSGNHTTDGNFDAWLAQIGPKGNLLSQHCYGGSGFDDFLGLVRSDGGSLIIVGNTDSNDGDVSGNHGGVGGDAWVVKINLFGKIIWQKTVGGTDDDGSSTDLVKTTDGNVVIDGLSFSTDGDINGKDTLVSFITKLNSSTGNIIWSKSYDKPGERGGFGQFATADGGTVETGAVGVIGVGETFDLLVSKFDANGNQEWYKRLGGTDYDAAQTGYESSNGDLNILCQTKSTDGDIKKPDGGVDEWIIKLGRCGNDLNNDAVSVNNAIASVKNNTTLLSNYPNPVSNSTVISFSVPQSQKAMPAGRQVSIRIFDMNGRLVKTLADEQMQAGTHQLIWNAKDEKGNAVVTGIYLLKMQADNYVETKKISVVK